MDTIVRPPEAPPRGPVADRPRRRWPRLVLLVALGLAMITGVGALLFAWRYQPLTVNGTGASWVDPRYGTRIGSFTPPDGAPFQHVVVRYRDGETLRYGMTLVNEGPVPVTVTRVGDPECDGCVFPLVHRRTLLAPTHGPWRYDHRRAAPFAPFVLAPGAFRYVVLEDRFDHCESYQPPGDGVTYLSVGVSYRTWGLDHHVQLPMPYSLEIRMRGGCPQDMGTEV